MAGQPKAPFYFAVLLVVGGLVALAAYQATKHGGHKEPKGDAPGLDITMPKAGGDTGPAAAADAEAPDSASITTVKEYKFKPSERLPPSKAPPPISRSKTTPCASPSMSGPAGPRSSTPTTASRLAKPGKRRTAKISMSSWC